MNLEAKLRELQFKNLVLEVQLRELIASRLEKIKLTEKDNQQLLDDFTFSRYYVPFVSIDDNSMEILEQLSHSGNSLLSEKELKEQLSKIARRAIFQAFRDCCIDILSVEFLDKKLWTFSFQILVKTSK